MAEATTEPAVPTALFVVDGKEYHIPRDVLDAAGYVHESVLDEFDEVDCDEQHVPDGAVQSFHEQAHNDPSDTLYAENCLREPCRSVA